MERRLAQTGIAVLLVIFVLFSVVITVVIPDESILWRALVLVLQLVSAAMLGSYMTYMLVDWTVGRAQSEQDWQEPPAQVAHFRGNHSPYGTGLDGISPASSVDHWQQVDSQDWPQPPVGGMPAQRPTLKSYQSPPSQFSQRKNGNGWPNNR